MEIQKKRLQEKIKVFGVYKVSLNDSNELEINTSNYRSHFTFIVMKRIIAFTIEENLNIDVIGGKIVLTVKD